MRRVKHPLGSKMYSGIAPGIAQTNVQGTGVFKLLKRMYRVPAYINKPRGWNAFSFEKNDIFLMSFSFSVTGATSI